MAESLEQLFASQGGVATTGQLKAAVGRAAFESGVACGRFVPVWTGVYAADDVDNHVRLAGLDLRAAEPVPICLGTAAAAYGFDTEDTRDLHVLTPMGHQLRSSDGLMVHRREGAPLTTIDADSPPSRRGPRSRWRGHCAARVRWPRWTRHCAVAPATALI